MNAELTLSSSLEDYLEAIYNIIKEKRAVRAKDIAARLKVSNASVTGALRTLSKRNFLNYAPYDVITLTQEGEKVAREIVRKHEVLRDFMVKVLLVDYALADEAACRLEHGIPKDIVDRLITFIEFMEMCPLGRTALGKGFKEHVRCRPGRYECEKCMEQVLDTGKASPGAGESDRGTTGMLSRLHPGESGVIRGIRARGSLRKRLLEMGFTPGSLVTVERVAPMGDPVEVNVKGYHLTLRKEEAEHIEVEIR